MSAGKGGARHFAKPFIDPGILFRVLHDHKELVQSMGIYDTISKNQALDPQGLVKMLPLLRALAKVEPTMEVHTGAMRQGLNSLLTEDPAINTTKFNGSVWVSLRQERLTTLLAHFRRLKTDGELRKCAQKLTAAEFLHLQEVVDKTTEKDPCQKEGLGKRKLKKEISDVSLDEDGFPKCFSSPSKVQLPTKSKKKRKVKKGTKKTLSKGSMPLPKGSSAETLPKGSSAETLAKGKSRPFKSFLRRRPGQTLQPCSSTWQEDDHLKGAMGLKRPAAAATSLAKGTTSLAKGTTSLAKGSKKKKSEAASGSKPPWVKLRVTRATNPERTYIVGTRDATPGAKLQLIVEVSKKRSTKHLSIINEIYKELESKSITKEEAIAMRERLCEF